MAQVEVKKGQMEAKSSTSYGHLSSINLAQDIPRTHDNGPQPLSQMVSNTHNSFLY